MVKRAPTPPPADDEPRHLTVVSPYPPYANMAKREELIAFIRWLACVMNGYHHHLYAVFHRPSAANMLVIEVSRDFPYFRHLLGAHKWADFVLNPGPHRDKVSRIYYSTYPNARAVEKAGWKRIFVEDVWFQGWHPRNKQVPVGSGLKQSVLPSHSPFQPIVLDDKPLNGKIAGGTRPSSVLLSDTTSKAESTIISTAASDISGTAVTVNGATLTWDFADGDKGDIGTDLDSQFEEEEEIDDYIANGYYNANLEENGKPVTDSHLSSVHPLLVNKNKPTCPSCGVLCKRSVCRDYNAFIRRIERKEVDDKSRQKLRSGRGRGSMRGRGQAKGGSGYRVKATPTYPQMGKTPLLNSEEHGDRIDKAKSGSSTISNNKIYERDIEGNDDKVSVKHAVLRSTTSSPSTIQKAQTPDPESQNTNIKTAISASPSSSCLNKVGPSPAIAWAKGNPITSKQNCLDVRTEEIKCLPLYNCSFPALGAGGASGKVTHAPITWSTSATSVNSRALAPGTTSVGSNGLGSAGHPSVASWAEIANSRARPASKPTTVITTTTVIPPLMGKVLTASINSSEEPLTISWEEVLKREMEVADFEEL